MNKSEIEKLDKLYSELVALQTTYGKTNYGDTIYQSLDVVLRLIRVKSDKLTKSLLKNK